MRPSVGPDLDPADVTDEEPAHHLPVEPVQGPRLAPDESAGVSRARRQSGEHLGGGSGIGERLARAARSASTVVATMMTTNSRSPTARNCATGLLTSLTSCPLSRGDQDSEPAQNTRVPRHTSPEARCHGTKHEPVGAWRGSPSCARPRTSHWGSGDRRAPRREAAVVQDPPPPGLAVPVAVDLSLELDPSVAGLGLDLPVGAAGAAPRPDDVPVGGAAPAARASG